jgi:hypothetical protein
LVGICPKSKLFSLQKFFFVQETIRKYFLKVSIVFRVLKNNFQRKKLVYKAFNIIIMNRLICKNSESTLYSTPKASGDAVYLFGWLLPAAAAERSLIALNF